MSQVEAEKEGGNDMAMILDPRVLDDQKKMDEWRTYLFKYGIIIN